MADEIKEGSLALKTTDFLSKENPRSLYNLVPTHVQEKFDIVPSKYLVMDERDLKKIVKPSATLNSLRFKFWQEYNRAQNMDENMRMGEVYRGICTQVFFNHCVLRSPTMASWLLTPPKTDMRLMEESLNFGVDRIREILELPLHDAKGKVNSAVANLILKAFALLDARVKGTPIQQHHIRSLSVTASANELNKRIEDLSMDEIEKKLKKLRDVDEIDMMPLEQRPTDQEFKAREIEVMSENKTKAKDKIF